MLPRQNKWLTRSSSRDSMCCVSSLDVGWKAQVTRDRTYTYIKHSVTKVASEWKEMRCQQFQSTRDTSLISALFDISTAALSSKRRTEDTNAPFVPRALCPFDCVPDWLRGETKGDRDVNGSMWFTICIPRPQGLSRLTVQRPDVQACGRMCHMVPSYRPYLRTLLVKFVSLHLFLADTSPCFIFDIDLAVTSPPQGTVASPRDMMKASKGGPPWLHTKQTPLWTLVSFCFSLQFKSRGGQRPAQIVVMCGSHVARAWVMPLSLVGPCRETHHKYPRTEITTTVQQLTLQI